MSIKYNHEQTEDIFRTNALVGIPEEVTALAVARRYQKEAEWNTVLAELARQNGFRKNGRSLQDLLEEVCTQMPERNLVLYSGTPQVHDYDEKHLLIEGISYVDVQGKVVESHPQAWVMKDVFRDGNGEILYFTLDQAVRHCEQRRYVLTSSQLACAIVAACFQHKDMPAAQKLLMQYKNKGNGNGLHVLNTTVNYENFNIISYPRLMDFSSNKGFEAINQTHQKIVLPFEKNRKRMFKPDLALESMSLEQGLKNELMSVFVRQFSGLPEPSILVEIGKYFGKEAWAWISYAGAIRPAWLGCDSNNFNLNTNSDLDYNGAARGVRFVAPEAPM